MCSSVTTKFQLCSSEFGFITNSPPPEIAKVNVDHPIEFTCAISGRGAAIYDEAKSTGTMPALWE